MQRLIRREVYGGTAIVAHSTRSDGDLSPATVARRDLAERRFRAVPHPWRVLRQVHSDRVINVSVASDGRPDADALVTVTPHLALAVHAGDCVPVGFISDGGAVATAHAGWKGLEAGVLESTIRQLRHLAPTKAIVAVVGPHIRKERYEFGEQDLNRLGRRFGNDVIATTLAGNPALDLTTAIASELNRLGVSVAAWSPGCTARDAHQYWSHRAREEDGRIALVAWLEVPPDD